MDREQILTLFILGLIISLGFWFRLRGIVDNHSFWSDEAYISSFAKDIALNKSSFVNGIIKIPYEPLQIGITAVFFKIFGISIFAARLPSVMFNTVGILFVYLLAKKLSNKNGGLLAAFLYAFSQLNLANSTQAKQYAILETLLLIIMYLLLELPQLKQKHTSKQLLKTTGLLTFGAILISCVAALYHLIGASFLLICGVYLVLQYSDIIQSIPYKPFIMVAFMAVVYLALYLTKGISFLSYLLTSHNGKFLFFFNYSVYLKNLFIRQYGVYFIPAIIGLLLILKHKKAYVISIAIWIFLLLFVWNFQYYSHNLRYLVPLFGVIFVMFGVFWGKVGEYASETFKVKSLKLLPIAIIIILYISGYKIVRKPLAYYSPNADFYGDVQIADYKDMYAQIRKKIPDYKHIAVFNDVIDTQRWYMPEKKIDAYFTKGITKPQKHPVEGGMIYGTLADFLKEQAKYPTGIVIVEDWQSFLPEDIKEYVKSRLKLQIKVNSLPDAKNDPWPLEVYSWGM